MRKLQLVLVAALLVGGSAIATAQDPQPQGQRQGGGRGMGMLMQGITLNAEQQAKVDSINAKYMTERRAIMQDETLDQDARRAKGREEAGGATPILLEIRLDLRRGQPGRQLSFAELEEPVSIAKLKKPGDQIGGL